MLRSPHGRGDCATFDVSIGEICCPSRHGRNRRFFTRTVIGPPLSVVLGRRQRRIRSRTGGLDVDLGGPGQRLDQLWRDWLITSHQDDPAGLPRRRPGRLRRWLERHALAVALAGVLSLATGLVLIGISTWK